MATDPAEIDLDAVIARRRPECHTNSIVLNDDFNFLIAAVEALREREMKLNGWLSEHESMLAKSRGETNKARRELEAAEARVAEMLDGEMKWSRRAEAAEAYAVKLAGALNQLIEEKADYMRLNNLGNPETQHTIKVGRAALAAPPPGAVERALERDLEHVVEIRKVTHLRQGLETYAPSIEKLAFEMKPPNEVTPRFIQLVVGLRQALQARRYRRLN